MLKTLKNFASWCNDYEGLLVVIALIATIVLAAVNWKWAAITAVLLIIFFLVILNSPDNRAHRLTKEVSIPKDNSVGPLTTQPKKRIVIDVTPEYLTGLFSNQTSIQAQKLADTFIGKWMKISGPLGDVSRFTTFSQVTFEHWIGGRIAVYMMFRDRKYVENRLAVLEKGHKITVLGQIDRIESVNLQLENCELVHD